MRTRPCGLVLGAVILATSCGDGDYAPTPPLSPSHGAHSNVIVVTTASDVVAPDGLTSLREAMITANSDGVYTQIHFNIPGCAGACVIQPLTALPALQESGTIIDGSTQPGDGNPVGPDIVLDGSLLEEGVGIVMEPASDHNVIRGLVIHSFPGTGVQGAGNGHLTVEDCYIGTDPTGTVAMGNGAEGVALGSGFDNVIRDNVIAGNVLTAGGAEIQIAGEDGSLTGRTLIEGNRIGTDRTGTVALSHPGRNGVWLFFTSDNIVQENLISGTETAVLIGDCCIPNVAATRNVIRNNLMGTDATGLNPLPNRNSGIDFLGPGVTANIAHDNTIAFNEIAGVVVAHDATRNTISRNPTFANTGLGIDLAPPGGCCGDGVTPNDPGDADAGANDLLNFPVLTLALTTAGNLLVGGSLDTPNPNLAIVEIFAAEPGGDPSGHGEGKVFLGVAHPNPVGQFTATLPTVPAGTRITATATDVFGNTSEFAANVVALAPGSDD